MSASELAAYSSVVGPTHAVNSIVPAPQPRTFQAVTQRGPTQIAVISPVPPSTPEPAQMVAAKPLSPSPAPPTTQRTATLRPMDGRTYPDKPAARGWAGIQLHVRGPASNSEAAAEEGALRKAREMLRVELDKLDPPVSITPSLMRIRSAYIPTKSTDLVDPKAREDLKALGGQWYEGVLTVALTDDQIRELRQEERVQNGLIGVGGLAVGSLVLFGLLRAGTAAGRLSASRLRPSRCVTAQTLFWTIGPPLILFLLARFRW